MDTVLVKFLEKRDELRELTRELSTRRTRTGRIFSQVSTILEAHLKNEDDTIIPVVKLLEKSLEGAKDAGSTKEATAARRSYKSKGRSMDQEHRELEGLCRNIQTILKEEPDKKESYATDQLLSLIKLEEEFVYAIANSYGDILKLNEFASSLDEMDFFIRVMP